MPVLITGSGLVGSQIARLEVERGERPVILELAPQADAVGEIVDLTSVKLLQGDVLSPLDLAKVIHEEGITRIIHTAANALLTEGAQRNPYPAVVLNIIGTLNVLEAARIFGIERVTFCSSSVLYQSMTPPKDPPEAKSEEIQARPATFYATTKQAAENLCLNYAATFGMDVRAVRFAAVFGPWRGRGGGGGPTQRFRELVERALRGQPASFPASPRPSEWVYSKDAAMGAVLASHAEGLQSRVFNIGMGKAYSSQDVIDTVRQLVPGARVELNETAGVPAAGAQPVGHAEAVMDPTRSRTELKYQPQYDLTAAFQDYIQFYRSKE